MAGHGNWDGMGGMDQITVVRIDDTHIAEDQSHVGGKMKGSVSEYYEVECTIPAEEEAAGEEEEDGVYVIEYSNPEEEGESYKFMMSVDQSPQARKPVTKHPDVRENARPRRLEPGVNQKRKVIAEEEEVKREEIVSNKSVLELGENYGDMMETNSASDKKLVCTMCPPPGKFFKRASGLAVHLKHAHTLEGKKTFFCTSCKQTVRSQIELDTHTKRHANKDAVFTCHLCLADVENKTGYKGTRWGLKKHLVKEHPGIIPRCNICNKSFKSLVSYLADQFRHVGVSPYYCGRCQIYEMTERGLSIHIKNHDKKKTELQLDENHPLTLGVSSNAENSATDDSDF